METTLPRLWFRCYSGAMTARSFVRPFRPRAPVSQVSVLLLIQLQAARYTVQYTVVQALSPYLKSRCESGSTPCPSLLSSMAFKIGDLWMQCRLRLARAPQRCQASLLPAMGPCQMIGGAESLSGSDLPQAAAGRTATGCASAMTKLRVQKPITWIEAHVWAESLSRDTSYEEALAIAAALAHADIEAYRRRWPLSARNARLLRDALLASAHRRRH